MTDWIREASEISGEIYGIRKYLHMHPELGNREFGTSDFIERRLNEYGIETERMLDTAVIGTLRFAKPGPVAALRADMDALPIQEKTGCGFSSLYDGVMHACGHDVHMSAALGAARLLKSHENELKGTVKFIFQPDEEGMGGALRLIEHGVMDSVDAIFGAHVDPELKEGAIGLKYGKFYAASDVFGVSVHGRSSHGAEPEKGIDALYAAALMVSELKKIPKAVGPDPLILTVGLFNSGTAFNILPGEAEFGGIIRSLGDHNRDTACDLFESTVRRIAERQKVTVDIDLTHGYKGIVNSDDITYFAEKTAAALIGADNVVIIDKPTMKTEDFGYYIDTQKGCFYHLGASSEYPLHSPYFIPGPDVPVFGAGIHAGLLSEFLLR